MPAKKTSKIVVAPDELTTSEALPQTISSSPNLPSAVSEPTKKAPRIELEDGTTRKGISVMPSPHKENSATASTSLNIQAKTTSDINASEELEEGVTVFTDDAATKAKAAEQKEESLLRKGEELSGDALRKFMQEQFLNFDDDPVADIEKLLDE